MTHIDVELPPTLQEDLETLMRLRGITSESEAICIAVKEALQRQTTHKPNMQWASLIGWANRYPSAPNAKPITEDDLWERGYLGH